MGAWNRIGFRGRIFAALGALVIITIGGGLILVWYTYRMENLLASIIQTDFATFRTANGLETALLNQRGYVSYYFLDGNPEWLKELGKHRQEFTERLKEAREIDRLKVHKDYLDRIESEYEKYVAEKERVIELYRAGDREAGSQLHAKVRDHFSRILELCEEHMKIHTNKLAQELINSRNEATRLRVIAGSGVSLAAVIGALLSFFIVRQILDPIKRLALEADLGGDSDSSGDEVSTLQDRVHGLIHDVDETHSELEKSRKRLLETERMAVVGKLAAEVAHSIRNPMTSINMRLFSLQRALDLSQTQKEDFQVITDEMRQLDNIVQNFLEFSRPPKLKLQSVSVANVMDMALQLLEKRLERYGIEVTRERRPSLPNIEADPEMLKEALVNLIVNACEAMGGGGSIIIKEEEVVAEHLGRGVLIRLTDTGPGIPESIRDQVLEPFFSTKEEGTGLGLPIAVRIVEEHGGILELHSEEGRGTTFNITLPVREQAS